MKRTIYVIYLTLVLLFLSNGGDMLESEYQALLIKKIESLLPGSIVMKNNPNWLQGVPDLLILFGNRWALLEVKASATSRERPNQRYYVELYSQMTFCAFIYPENEEEVLRALQQSLAV